MNPSPVKLTHPLNNDALNEFVLEAAAVISDVESIAEQLVDAGNAEADFELRLATATDHGA